MDEKIVVTKSDYVISAVSKKQYPEEKFPEIVSRAYNLATMGRKGGVLIDFPFNIQKADCNCR